MKDFNRLITRTRFLIQQKSVFFSTLSMLLKIKKTTSVNTAFVAGKTIYINQDFFESIDTGERAGVFLHEVLHLVLLHHTRRLAKEPRIWNVACDIVVNLIISNIKEKDGIKLPKDAILPPPNFKDFGLSTKPEWHKMSAEEVYNILIKNMEEAQKIAFSDEMLDLKDIRNIEDEDAQLSKKEIENYIKQSLLNVKSTLKKDVYDDIPTNMQRYFENLTSPQINWKNYLWKYLVKTPNDFQGYDRRFVGRGVYIDALEGQSISVYVGIDSSGSISNSEMSLFLSELRGILGSYPHIKCKLYYIDAKAYGPYSMDQNSNIPDPEGGGGTSFIPFFNAIKELDDYDPEACCVYLTDGYGEFPEKVDNSTLWIITAGGLDSNEVPFGECVRLLED